MRDQRRLVALVGDAGPAVILTDDAHRERGWELADGAAEVISIDEDVSSLPVTDPEHLNEIGHFCHWAGLVQGLF